MRFGCNVEAVLLLIQQSSCVSKRKAIQIRIGSHLRLKFFAFSRKDELLTRAILLSVFIKLSIIITVTVLILVEILQDVLDLSV